MRDIFHSTADDWSWKTRRPAAVVFKHHRSGGELYIFILGSKLMARPFTAEYDNRFSGQRFDDVVVGKLLSMFPQTLQYMLKEPDDWQHACGGTTAMQAAHRYAADLRDVVDDDYL